MENLKKTAKHMNDRLTCQEDLDNVVSSLVFDQMLPLSFVDSDGFRNFTRRKNFDKLEFDQSLYISFFSVAFIE